MESKKKIGKSSLIVILIIGVVIGFAASWLYLSSQTKVVSKESAVEQIKELYKLTGLPDVEVPASLDESGLYKFIVRSGTNSIDVYMSRDGKLLFQNPIDVNNFATQLKNRQAFFDCLASKNFKFYGSTETNATLLQIQLLGGANYLEKIYIGCEGDQGAQFCVSQGIESVPSFVFNNITYTGVQQISQIEQLTNCTYVR